MEWLAERATEECQNCLGRTLTAISTAPHGFDAQAWVPYQVRDANEFEVITQPSQARPKLDLGPMPEHFGGDIVAVLTP